MSEFLLLEMYRTISSTMRYEVFCVRVVQRLEIPSYNYVRSTMEGTFSFLPMLFFIHCLKSPDVCLLLY